MWFATYIKSLFYIWKHLHPPWKLFFIPQPEAFSCNMTIKTDIYYCRYSKLVFLNTKQNNWVVFYNWLLCIRNPDYAFMKPRWSSTSLERYLSQVLSFPFCHRETTTKESNTRWQGMLFTYPNYPLWRVGQLLYYYTTATPTFKLNRIATSRQK